VPWRNSPNVAHLEESNDGATPSPRRDMPRAANDQAACFEKMSGARDAGKEHENVGDALRHFAMEHLVWQGDRTMGCEFEMRILDQKGE
jgi:hypothetical protein